FQAVKTAQFNTHTRVLTIPIYNKSLKRQTISMFIGHEVGHALWTPEEELVSALTNKKNHTAYFKDFLNVAEDVRIERKIKQKYPGIVKDFYAGYQDLFNGGFFGEPKQVRVK